MTTFFIYILKVIVCSALFSGYYWWILRNGNFFRWNRLFINASVILSITIPLLSISIPTSPIVMQETYNYVVNYTTIENSAITTIPAQSEISPVSWVNIFFMAYLIVTFIILMKEFVSLLRLIRLKRHAERIHANEATLYCIDDKAAPFTFFRTIFWRKCISPDSGKGACMLQHELAHVRLDHSCDKALMQLVCCIFWINPFFILLRRELELVHEFEADREGIGEGNIEELSSLILCTVYPNHYRSFTSRFFQSSIKRRLFMITKREKSKLSIIRKICIVPIVIITLFAFSVKSEITVVSHVPNHNAKDKVTVVGFDRMEGVPDNPWTPQNELEKPIVIIGYRATEITSDTNIITAVAYPQKRKAPPNGVLSYNDVEVKPRFIYDNVETVFKMYFSEKINFPTNAIENDIIGEVVASYIVNENGKVDNIEIEVSADQSLANEIIRVLKNSPDWIPGRQNDKNVPVQCYIFTQFKLQ